MYFPRGLESIERRTDGKKEWKAFLKEKGDHYERMFERTFDRGCESHITSFDQATRNGGRVRFPSSDCSMY